MDNSKSMGSLGPYHGNLFLLGSNGNLIYGKPKHGYANIYSQTCGSHKSVDSYFVDLYHGQMCKPPLQLEIFGSLILGFHKKIIQSSNCWGGGVHQSSNTL